RKRHPAKELRSSFCTKRLKALLEPELPCPLVDELRAELAVSEARQLCLHVIFKVLRITVEPGQDMVGVEGSVSSACSPHSPEKGAPGVVVAELRVIDVDRRDCPGKQTKVLGK